MLIEVVVGYSPKPPTHPHFIPVGTHTHTAIRKPILAERGGGEGIHIMLEQRLLGSKCYQNMVSKRQHLRLTEGEFFINDSWIWIC